MKGQISASEIDHARESLARAVVEVYGGNQSRAARAWGCSPGALNRVLAGQRRPIEILAGASRALGTTVDHLLGRGSSGSSPPPSTREPWPSEALALRELARDRHLEASREELEAAAAAVAVAAPSEDPGLLWWIDEIRSQVSETRRRRARALTPSPPSVR